VGGLSFAIRTEGDTVIVTVAGDVDLANATELAETLSSLAGSHDDVPRRGGEVISGAVGS